jgi:hypothetical protein
MRRNVPHVVSIPVESMQTVKHNRSIYDICIYNQALAFDSRVLSSRPLTPTQPGSRYHV